MIYVHLAGCNVNTNFHQIHPFSVFDHEGVIYNIPLGKPDPSLECPEGQDTRPRVRREAAEQSLCFFVAAQVLRKHTGPKFCTALKSLQAFDQALNQLLDEQARHEASIKVINDEFSDNWKTFDKEAVKQNFSILISKIKFFTENNDSKQKRHFQETATFWANFLKQDRHQSLYDYFWDLKFRPRAQIQLTFMRATGCSNAEIALQLMQYANENQGNLLRKAGDTFEEIPPKEWGGLMQLAVQMGAAIHYGIEPSLWMPSEDFSGFLQKLREHGPLLVMGDLGFHVYLSDPSKLQEKWGSREVYAWKPGTPKTKNLSVSHTVTVIGAVRGPETANGGYVYFLDPRNISDPHQPTLDKIYKISYKNLRENMVPFGYLYHGTNKGRPKAFAFHQSLSPAQMKV